MSPRDGSWHAAHEAMFGSYDPHEAEALAALEEIEAERDQPQRPAETATFLQVSPHRRASKVLTLDAGGTWRAEGYDAGDLFRAVEHTVSGIHELGAVVEAMRRDASAFYVRGKLTDARRQRLAENPAYRFLRRGTKGHGADGSLDDVPSRIFTADVDGVPLPEGLTLRPGDLNAAIDHVVRTCLPAPFHDATCYWHLSSTAGLKPGIIKVHLWFWLAEPATNDDLRAWAMREATSLDYKIYTATQPFYGADPVFVGAADPLPVRAGWRLGATDEVAKSFAQPAAAPRQARSPKDSAKRQAHGAPGRDAGGYASLDAALAHLGDGEGLGGFHGPLLGATWCYAQATPAWERDDAAFIARLQAAILAAPKDRTRRSGVSEYLDHGNLKKLIAGADKRLAKPARERPTCAPSHGFQTVTLDTAAAVMNEQLRDFFQRVTAFRNPPGPMLANFPERAAIAVSVGVGKSHLARVHLAEWLKRAGCRALFFVPSHKLSAEVAAAFEKLGVTAHVWRGRGATNPETGKPMCDDLDAVEDALEHLLSVESAICGKPLFATCPHFDACPYQRQKPSATEAQVVILSHEFLFTPLPPGVGEGFGVAVVDESFWQAGLQVTSLNADVLLAGFVGDGEQPVLRDGPDDTRVPHPQATLALEDLHRSLATALDRSDGYLTRKTVEAVGLTATQAQQAAKWNWARKVELAVHPGMSPTARKAELAKAPLNGTIPRLAAIWNAVADLLHGDEEATGRIASVRENVGGEPRPKIRLKLKRPLNGVFDGAIDLRPGMPILLLDATLPRPTLRHFLPGVTVLADLNVETPHQRVHQVLGPSGKSTLCEHKEAAPVENARRAARVSEMRDVVEAATAAMGRTGVVITYLGIEPAFEGIPGVATAHFNNIAGLDAHRDVDVLVVIGAPTPAPDDVADLAAALTGRPLLPAVPVRHERGILMRDGTGRQVDVYGYADPDLELVRSTIAESELVQAIGRGRGTRRTAASPLDVLLIANAALPVAVDRVSEWKSIAPNAIDRALARGLMPSNSSDAHALLPDIFPSAQAAKWHLALARGAPGAGGGDEGGEEDANMPAWLKARLARPGALGGACLPLVGVTYQRAGKGERPHRLWARADWLPRVREMLEAATGPLASLAVDGQEATGAGNEASPLARLVATGLVPEAPADAFALCPGVFKNPWAARAPCAVAATSFRFRRVEGNGQVGEVPLYRYLHKENSRTSANSSTHRHRNERWAEVRYQPAGRGGRPRRAWVREPLLVQARAALEATLGPLALFEVVEEEQAMPAEPSARLIVMGEDAPFDDPFAPPPPRPQPTITSTQRAVLAHLSARLEAVRPPRLWGDNLDVLRMERGSARRAAAGQSGAPQEGSGTAGQAF